MGNIYSRLLRCCTGSGTWFAQVSSTKIKAHKVSNMNFASMLVQWQGVTVNFRRVENEKIMITKNGNRVSKND